MGATAKPLCGDGYRTVLAGLHSILKPSTYLEVGSRTGDSLAIAACASIAIDPAFHLAPAFMGTKSLCALYQMPSDTFFRTVDATAVLGGPVDFAFLDGMHLAEFLLRDFANTERLCRPNSIIALHDCIHVNSAMTRRAMNDDAGDEDGSPYAGWWTGDVWKVVVMLRTHRPDLRVHAFDAPPTGLILITNLDPASTLLRSRYHDIADEMRDLQFPGGDIESYHDWLSIRSTAELRTAEDIAREFWM